MKTKNRALILLGVVLLIGINFKVLAKDEERNVAAFSEISLRIPATVHVEQGKKQSVEVVAKSSTLNDIITEVKNRKLTIRFPKKNIFLKNFTPGKIEIFITVPEVDALGVSGSGDIIAEELDTRILDLAVSGSGDILIEELKSERIKAAISGSGNIEIEKGGPADDLSIAMSGSGNFKGEKFKVKDVVVKIAGSGNCYVNTNGSLKARLAGSGNVYYYGNPTIDSSIAGSGNVKKRD